MLLELGGIAFLQGLWKRFLFLIKPHLGHKRTIYSALVIKKTEK